MNGVQYLSVEDMRGVSYLPLSLHPENRSGCDDRFRESVLMHLII